LAVGQLVGAGTITLAEYMGSGVSGTVDWDSTPVNSTLILTCSPIVSSSSSSSGSSSSSSLDSSSSSSSLDSSSSSSSSIDSSSESSANVGCNACSPPLHNTYTITLTGLAGDFVGFNNTFTVTWDSGCYWRWFDLGSNEILLWYDATEWSIIITTDTFTCCMLTLDGSTNVCTVIGSYSYTTGIYTDCSCCSDTNSCTNSSGAAAIVS
jgi:hypothetical protein